MFVVVMIYSNNKPNFFSISPLIRSTLSSHSEASGFTHVVISPFDTGVVLFVIHSVFLGFLCVCWFARVVYCIYLFHTHKQDTWWLSENPLWNSLYLTTTYVA